MAVLNDWKLVDLDTFEEYQFEIGPSDAAVPKRTRTTGYSTRRLDNKILNFEHPDGPREGQFSGTIVSQAQLEAMQEWANKRNMISLRDELGRQYTIYPTGLEARRERRASHPWFHTYTFFYTVIDESYEEPVEDPLDALVGKISAAAGIKGDLSIVGIEELSGKVSAASGIKGNLSVASPGAGWDSSSTDWDDSTTTWDAT